MGKMRIRIQESDGVDRFSQRYHELTGQHWPPKTSAEMAIVLRQAGFSPTEVGQFLNEFGFEGWEEAGRPPQGYVSTSGDDHPAFSSMFIQGLELYYSRQAQPPKPKKKRGPKSKFTPEQLDQHAEERKEYGCWCERNGVRRYTTKGFIAWGKENEKVLEAKSPEMAKLMDKAIGRKKP